MSPVTKQIIPRKLAGHIRGHARKKRRMERRKFIGNLVSCTQCPSSRVAQQAAADGQAVGIRLGGFESLQEAVEQFAALFLQAGGRAIRRTPFGKGEFRGVDRSEE